MLMFLLFVFLLVLVLFLVPLLFAGVGAKGSLTEYTRQARLWTGGHAKCLARLLAYERRRSLEVRGGDLEGERFDRPRSQSV